MSFLGGASKNSGGQSRPLAGKSQAITSYSQPQGVASQQSNVKHYNNDMSVMKLKSDPPISSEPQSSSLTTTSTDTAKLSTTKLVFGLNPRTNRLKHDEYAEKRGARSQIIERSLQSDSLTSSNPGPAIGSVVTSAEIKETNSVASANPRGSIRASRYGNYYKPKDLVVNKSSVNKDKPITTPSGDKTPSTGQANRAGVSPVRESSSDNKGKSPRRDSPSEGRSRRAASPRRTPDTASSQEATTNGRQASQSLMRDQHQQQQQQQQQVPQKVSIKKFNIPLPPQVSTPGSGGQKGSVVSYAKSRIYDKQQNMALQQKQFSMADSSLGSPMSGNSPLWSSAAIPESILSGIKPPKQINVSKAREKWEGGEPFNKCKSRQRLAAAQAANRKLVSGSSIAGGWYSTQSVVAAQQLQLQQLSQQSSASKTKEGPVKILSRGSVLERVQQFERAPASEDKTSSEGAGSVSDSGSSLSSSSSTISSSSISSGESSVIDIDASDRISEASLALDKPLEPCELQPRPNSPTSKQAIYKSRVSSIQSNGSQPADPLASLTSPKGSPLGQIRRASLRRRSSAGTTKPTNSTGSQIPKFYHPNGKPNTYEIELQKKNIVACFDKFPDHKASITGPSYRRHFHAIALACGFSEYFKEPLYLYIRHQMTSSNLLIGASIGPGSPVSLNSSDNNSDSVASSPGDSPKAQGQPKLRPLIKAASIDNSMVDKIQNQTFISCDQFLICWRQIISSAFDNHARFVHLLTKGQRNYLVPNDFMPLIQSIIDDHPGLKFLRAAPDFHLRYIQTVIARIYYCINRSWTGKITLSELRRSNLLAVLQVLSLEEDINQITDYFSYEHFYVIYCKFWSLDKDHDLLLSKEDLAKHNDAAISSRIIDRIFMGIVSKQIQGTGKMSYWDFVWFLLAEEDKKHPRSIEYWFRLMDLDGDGYISMYEMEYFYFEQVKRLELMSIEALPFIDSACQILDLVNPKEKNRISLVDLKRTKMTTVFFDTFINLEKYLEHESREFVSTRDIVQDGVVISDWDRYASEEYESLVSEDTTV